MAKKQLEPELISDFPQPSTRYPELDVMVERMRSLQQELETVSKAKEHIESMLAAIQNNDIPEAMMMLELTEYHLEDGATLELEHNVYTSLTKADRDGVMRWLIAQSADHLIKHVMTITFARGEHAKAVSFKRMVEKILPHADIEVTVGKSAEQIGDAVRAILKESFPEHTLEDEWQVHGGQLKAFVGKALKAGINIPSELGIYAPQVATLREPKKEEDPTLTQSEDNL